MEKNRNRFITPAWIGSNTEDLAGYLEKIGYIRSPFYSPDEGILWTSGDKYYSTSYQPSGELKIGERVIPYGIWCGENKELFKSLVSLKDGDDSYQWFTDDRGTWEMGESESPSRYMQMEGHKATLEELIEYFNG